MNYDWAKFYAAAVLETNAEFLPKRINVAQHAIGQRVMSDHVDDCERRAIVAALKALAVLRRERASGNWLCSQCFDEAVIVTALNGRTFLARTAFGEITVSLHTKCVDQWIQENDCETIVPLKKRHAGLPTSPGNSVYTRTL